MQKLRIFGIGAGILAATLWAFEVPLATIFLVGVWLLCPLMMMGMHGGHGHGSHEGPGSHEGHCSHEGHGPHEAHRPEETHERREISRQTGGDGGR